jgi:hypothetical protein
VTFYYLPNSEADEKQRQDTTVSRDLICLEQTCVGPCLQPHPGSSRSNHLPLIINISEHCVYGYQRKIVHTWKELAPVLISDTCVIV